MELITGEIMAEKSKTLPCSRHVSRDRQPIALFARQFTAGDQATRAVLADLVAALQEGEIGAEDRATVELILAEALNNVVEHAYADGPGPVSLSVERRCDNLLCRIVDQGRPMPTDEAPDPPLPTINPPGDLPEGGFGWHIIRCLTTELSYRREAPSNTLSMRVPLVDFD